MTVTAEPVVGELMLPDVDATSDAPDPRHAICGYEWRRVSLKGLPAALAVCGTLVRLPVPLTRPPGQRKCAECLRLAATHGQHCDCWKLWANGLHP